MRLLFELLPETGIAAGRSIVRPSVRGIIRKQGRVAMVHSLKYDYYKFPGGGIEPGESQEETLIRETREEAGLTVLPDSIREYGYVHRVQPRNDGSVFLQDNYYYLCDTESDPLSQQLDDYEQEERFTLEYVNPRLAITVNRRPDHGPKDQQMLEREARVLECLLAEGIL